MFKKYVLLILLFVISTNKITSQSRTILNDINKVWKKFYQAFDSLDYTLMSEIHSKKLIRISGGKRISDYKTYIKSYI